MRAWLRPCSIGTPRLCLPACSRTHIGWLLAGRQGLPLTAGRQPTSSGLRWRTPVCLLKVQAAHPLFRATYLLRSNKARFACTPACLCFWHQPCCVGAAYACLPTATPHRADGCWQARRTASYAAGSRPEVTPWCSPVCLLRLQAAHTPFLVSQRVITRPPACYPELVVVAVMSA